MNHAEIIKQNRVTRKKLRKAIKRQAESRKNYAAKIGELTSERLDCAVLLGVFVRQIIDVFNNGEFSHYTPVTFDLGFVKISYADGVFYNSTVTLPSKSTLDEMVKSINKKGA